MRSPFRFLPELNWILSVFVNIMSIAGIFYFFHLWYNKPAGKIAFLHYF